MPLVDKPLHELKTYAGRNPCPPDMDAFWDASLREMEATDPAVELKPASFQAPGAECFDMYFIGVGGARVHAKYLRPKQAAGKHPAVLSFHGYGGNVGDWHDKLAYVKGLGYSLAALDCRGQGGPSHDLGGVLGTTFRGHIVRGLDDPDPRQLALRQIFLDTAMLAKIVAGFDEVDEDRIGALGSSQGGALALACAALAPHLIKRAGSTFPFLSDYQRVWEMDLAENAYEELKYYFRHFDPQHRREQEIFTRLGYVDIQHLAKRIRGEVLMGCGLMDKICPPSSQFAAYNKIPSKKDVMVYPDFGHEGLPGFNDAVFQLMAAL